MAYPPAPPPGPAHSAGPPPNHLPWAIATTILCCLPAGIVSIVFAAQVNSKWMSGDQAGAYKASNNAKTWAIVSAVLGVIVGVIYFFIAMASSSST
ncbi:MULTISPECIES: CD225/dispanin family protein [Actinomadura]|uniref:Interferon-induced transmembrane protein n=1 Tax=Actinomadura madurae TaxID=1993 RepID=A0A1I5YH39_9ACTN|nr:CD225/dispanin family protein [Actinomadura madurae]SFQ43506.1 Interferon-induced transmembrane protein [Actinomadura madurae]SPT58217.1 Interferon-induced transmembrane protein [Actinomadura madurae]